MAEFDINGALQEGYSKLDIARYLQQQGMLTPQNHFQLMRAPDAQGMVTGTLAQPSRDIMDEPGNQPAYRTPEGTAVYTRPEATLPSRPPRGDFMEGLADAILEAGDMPAHANNLTQGLQGLWTAPTLEQKAGAGSRALRGAMGLATPFIPASAIGAPAAVLRSLALGTLASTTANQLLPQNMPQGYRDILTDLSSLAGGAIGAHPGVGNALADLPEYVRDYDFGSERGSLPVWRMGKTKLADINDDYVIPVRGKRLEKADVMRYLESQVQKHYGPISPDAPPSVKLKRLLRFARPELEDQLKQPDPKLDFYLVDTPQADADMIQMFPELGTDTKKMTLMKAASAVLAQGANPEAESMNGGRAYRYWRENGELPVVQPNDLVPGTKAGKKWSTSSGSDPIIKLQGFINTFKNAQDPTGLTGLERILTGDYPIGYLRTFNKNIKGKANDFGSGSLILGPKIGSYFLDISGIPQEGATVDMWDTLAQHRRMGYLFTPGGKPIVAPQKVGDREVFMDLHRALEDEFGLKRTQSQSGLWHYEKDLYKMLGTPTPVKGRSDGSKRLLDAWGHERENIITPENAPPRLTRESWVRPQSR